MKATKEINLSVGTFAHEGEIHTDKLTIATDNGVKITNAENNFNALEIASRDGNAINGSIDVTIKTNTFAPSIKNDVTGDVTLTNSNENGSIVLPGYGIEEGRILSVGGILTFDVGGDFLSGRKGYFANNNINITSRNGNISMVNIEVKSGEGNIQIGNDTTEQNNTTVVFAKRDITIMASNGTVNILGNIESTSGSINIAHTKHLCQCCYKCN